MATVTTVRIRVFDSKIHSMALPGGSVHSWTKGVVREMEAEAIATCPRRTGAMATHHGHSVGTNAHGTFGYVTNDADYAMAVHEGTHGPIRAVGNYMVVRPAPHSFYAQHTRRKTVAGQRAQPWIAEAMVAVLAAHGVV
jgi:hypothetical protein